MKDSSKESLNILAPVFLAMGWVGLALATMLQSMQGQILALGVIVLILQLGSHYLD